jgi:hypothetical protein
MKTIFRRNYFKVTVEIWLSVVKVKNSVCLNFHSCLILSSLPQLHKSSTAFSEIERFLGTTGICVFVKKENSSLELIGGLNSL